MQPQQTPQQNGGGSTPPQQPVVSPTSPPQPQSQPQPAPAPQQSEAQPSAPRPFVMQDTPPSPQTGGVVSSSSQPSSPGAQVSPVPSSVPQAPPQPSPNVQSPTQSEASSNPQSFTGEALTPQPSAPAPGPTEASPVQSTPTATPSPVPPQAPQGAPASPNATPQPPQPTSVSPPPAAPVPASAPGAQTGQPQAPQDVTSQQPTQQQADAKAKASRLKRFAIIAGGIFGLLVIFTSVAFAIPGIFGASVTYEELTRTGTINNEAENISIAAPVEMEEVFLGERSMELRHKGDDGRGMISELNVDGTFIGASHMDDAVEHFSDELMNQDSETYQALLSDGAGEEYENFEVGNFKELDGVDSSARAAYIADVTFDIPLVDDADTYVGAKGVIVYVFGDEIVYGIGIAALEEVWDGNRTLFGEVTQSIRIET